MDTLADLVVKLSADFGDVESQLTGVADSLKKIGDTAVATGAELHSGMDAALQSLEDKGATLAEAMAQLDAGFKDVGAAAAPAAEQLNLFDEALSVPYEDATGQLNL